MEYIKRHLESSILKASQHFPVVMVCGQRQTGKSTMLKHLSEQDRVYVNFDDARTRELAKNDPDLFFETFGKKLVIDEFQRVPSILLEIKKIVDETNYKGENSSGMFWLSGSQKFEMMKNVSESLAGRVAVFNMLPLSLREIEGVESKAFDTDLEILKNTNQIKKTEQELFECIYNGGLPRIIADKDMDRELYYSSYITTYIERDISSLAQVGKLDEFRNFMIYMAANTAQELKYDAIASVVGVSSHTIKEWVTILERSGIIYILKPYSNNISKRLVKIPKFYFLDTGLAAYLTSWPNSETLRNGISAGAFFETFVFSEILKSYINAGKTPNLYYYRDAEKKEIDLLVVGPDWICPIEIKKGKNPSNPTKNFAVLSQFGTNIKTGLVICSADELFPLSKEAWICPVGLI